jgi:hypothetical protein
MTADATAAAAYPGLFYPDVSGDAGPVDLSGIHAVCVKCTEGTYYQAPHYAAHVANAKAAGAFCFAYHFLTTDNPQAQAEYCHQYLDHGMPLMVDVETETQTGSKPSLRQNLDFVTHFRSLGGTVHLNYLPNWYWSSVWGSPDLAPLKDLGLVLVSSDYAGYGTHAGWAPYGGMTPTIWQYTSSVSLHGVPVDFNAFLGSGATDAPTLVEDLKAIVTTGKLPGQRTWHELVTNGGKSLAEIARASGLSPAALLRATAVRYGQFDAVTHAFLDGVFAGTVAPGSDVPAGARFWVLR